MKTKNDKIYDFLKSLETKIDLVNLVNIEEIDLNNPFESIYEMIEDENGFDIEIIYYKDAMDYLSENDPSLCDSLGLAAEFGYTIENLNSETLASLLASQKERENFDSLEEEINDFFEELEEEEEEEEE